MSIWCEAWNRSRAIKRIGREEEQNASKKDSGEGWGLVGMSGCMYMYSIRCLNIVVTGEGHVKRDTIPGAQISYDHGIVTVGCTLHNRQSGVHEGGIAFTVQRIKAACDSKRVFRFKCIHYHVQSYFVEDVTLL